MCHDDVTTVGRVDEFVCRQIVVGRVDHHVRQGLQVGE